MSVKLTYVYPMRQRVSFQLIARKHIEQLRKRGWEIVEIDVHDIKEWQLTKHVLVHPLFYPTFDHPGLLRALLRRTEFLGGFDVADSDHISQQAALIASLTDLVIVPSKWAQQVYARSGVRTRVEVLPHGVSDAFLREPREPRHPAVRDVASKRCFKFLFFLWHSGYRKGADVLAEAWARAKLWDRACLIIKTAELHDPFLDLFMPLKGVYVVRSWLDEEDLVDLYDAVDAVVVPSRGGGFEMNAIEALARGKPVIVSQWPAFDDYCKLCLRVRSRGLVDVFGPLDIAHRVHDGKGVNPDPEDLANKMRYVVESYDTVLRNYKPVIDFVRREFTWNAIGEKLHKLLKYYIG